MGARPLLDDVRALARRARLSLESASSEPTAVADPVPFGLTDREREVLTLVAAGRSNGQIAAALFISPKTASVHVSNILAKLGVSGRVEAAAVAHRLGLLDAG
jgi:DNA-binding CsgD family transcriptional regulator